MELDGLLQSLWDQDIGRREGLMVPVWSDQAMMDRLVQHGGPLFAGSPPISAYWLGTPPWWRDEATREEQPILEGSEFAAARAAAAAQRPAADGQ